VYDESVFEKMGIAARKYNGVNTIASSETSNASELRPKRRTHIPEREDMPSTVDKAEKKFGEFSSEKEDNTEQIIASLGEFEKEIFSEIPIDRAISMDALCALGYTIGDVMSALTLLEVKGLVMPLPGSLYIRK
jgi:hypothetical protein